MKNLKEKTPAYRLDPQGGFVIENYNHAKPFANFFPGIAGRYGIPMWVFYVNRGQAISSFGIKDKDNAILEFFPANRAWQFTGLCGFRTFIKLPSAKKPVLYEPFHNGWTSLGFSLTNRMRITSYGLVLEEENLSLGLRVKVEYFTIPNDPYAGLVRMVEVENTKNTPRTLELLDGLPQIVPFGTNNFFLKNMSRTIEAWMNIENLDRSVPFYKLAVDPSDKPEVVRITEGNFYLCFHHEKGKPRLIRPIIEPQYIFGPVTDFSCPRRFLAEKKFQAPHDEVTVSKTPCAFMFTRLELKAKTKHLFYAVSGYMRNVQTLNASVARITAHGYLQAKSCENKKIIEELENDIATSSSSEQYNLYAKQTYLDNILRGGYPHVFANGSVFYLYSRKHGDLERDYNSFCLQPTYFSQGNGNYRDANQNRRSDIWFNPQVQDANIITFLNLIQADGFNPLLIKGARFILADWAGFETKIKSLVDEKHLPGLRSFLKKPFAPGELVLYLKENKVRSGCCDELLEITVSCSRKSEEAEHGEGFWTDHWAYNLDLLESYLGVYPEKTRELFFKKKIFTFFDNIECVRPRSEKYLCLDKGLMQIDSLARDAVKQDLILSRCTEPYAVRDQYGQGAIYRTTLVNKLLCLFANKMASLDPCGAGIEMEANKPNWFDALNGLPALFGSSICETFELKRLAIMLKRTLEDNRIDKLCVTEEVLAFLYALAGLINEYLGDDSQDKDYRYWDKSYALKEEYRRKTKLGFSGREEETACGPLINLLGRALEKLDRAIAKAKKKDGLYYSYFINEPAGHRASGQLHAMPTRFIQKKVPLFLEGQMHGLRLAQNTRQAKAIYAATKNSPLYDKKLKMYKVTAPLEEMPEEIGRCRIFAPGWLENESIWLHMEYKYLLEILKSGLYEEFYQEFKNLLIPFQDPAQYGRSILENSSFLVSSAFHDTEFHGRGFVARLSGSTAEFLQIWLVLNAGHKPFFLDENKELALRFKPILAGWMFDPKEKTYGFNFLSKIWVTYHNPGRKNTFGKDGARVQKIMLNDKDGALVEINKDTLPCPYAHQARSRQLKRIDIFLE